MKRLIGVFLLVLIPFTAGCAAAGRNTAGGSLLGSALGAGAGAIVGHQVGHAGEGAAIGAGLGALAGGLIGNSIDRSEEEAAARTEDTEYRARRAEIRAERALHEVRAGGPGRGGSAGLSVLDVIRLSQAGVSDSVILAKIDESGSRFALSASEILDLRRSGVSDRVIERMIRTSPPPGRTRILCNSGG